MLWKLNVSKELCVVPVFCHQAAICSLHMNIFERQFNAYVSGFCAVIIQLCIFFMTSQNIFFICIMYFLYFIIQCSEFFIEQILIQVYFITVPGAKWWQCSQQCWWWAETATPSLLTACMRVWKGVQCIFLNYIEYSWIWFCSVKH